MLRLAVTTRAETFERMQSPLSDRGIAVDHLETRERAISIERGPNAFDSAQFDVGFVYPPRLAEGGVADALLSIPWINGREQVLRSRNKGETLARLADAGLPTPRTHFISNPVTQSELRTVFEEFEGPVVVKPNNTTRGVGVARADDLDSFLGICDYLSLVHDYRATGDRSFIVQEFLPDVVDFRVMVVDGTVAGAVKRELPKSRQTAGQWKHNVHRGATATGVDLSKDHRKLAERVASVLDIPWLGVDLLVTPEEVVVNETNARPTIDEETKYKEGFWDAVAALVRNHAKNDHS